MQAAALEPISMDLSYSIRAAIQIVHLPHSLQNVQN